SCATFPAATCSCICHPEEGKSWPSMPGAIIGLGALREEPFHCYETTTLSACEFKCRPARGLKHELARNLELCMEALALAHERLKKRAVRWRSSHFRQQRPGSVARHAKDVACQIA